MTPTHCGSPACILRSSAVPTCPGDSCPCGCAACDALAGDVRPWHGPPPRTVEEARARVPGWKKGKPTAPVTILAGDALAVLRTLPEASVQTCVTSPPYWKLRAYLPEGHADKALEMGSEPTPALFVAALVAVFEEVRRVLRADGTLWLNLGDTYAGSWGAQGRQGETGQMAGRRVATARISKRQVAAAPKTEHGTGTPPEGFREKNLVGIPWRVALALQYAGWNLRSEIIWHKLNPMPESVTDRPTKAHEHVFLLTKSAGYAYYADAIREPHQDLAGGPERFGSKGQANEPRKVDEQGHARSRMVSSVAPADGYNPLGRNARTVWTIATQKFPDAHFATFPEELARRCILAGSKPGDVVLDPFCGAGTTGLVADKHQRRFVGIELNPANVSLARERIARDGAPLLSGVA